MIISNVVGGSNNNVLGLVLTGMVVNTLFSSFTSVTKYLADYVKDIVTEENLKEAYGVKVKIVSPVVYPRIKEVPAVYTGSGKGTHDLTDEEVNDIIEPKS